MYTLCIQHRNRNLDIQVTLVSEEQCIARARLEAGEELRWTTIGYYTQMQSATVNLDRGDYMDFTYWKNEQLTPEPLAVDVDNGDEYPEI
jgi:hypothetical protein